MRAWQLDNLGNPLEKLRLNEIADAPEPEAGQVTVSIKAVGISFPDVLQCRGEYQVKPALPWIPGGESAGIVSAVGHEVTTLEIGDRVMMLGGGLVDQVNVHEMGVWKVPESFALDKAAAVPVNYGTTWFALHERGQLAEGETLLITGAAGGTGSAAIQLGKAAGAKVIAVAGGKDKVEQAKMLGADHIVDHQKNPDWVDEVRDASDGGVTLLMIQLGEKRLIKLEDAWHGTVVYLLLGSLPGFLTFLQTICF